MKHFSTDESRIRSLFPQGATFLFEERVYVVDECGKPTSKKGEPKTDIYIKAMSDEVAREFKITFKKKNADFIENKINQERAEHILGSSWKKIIRGSIQRIQPSFLSKPLIYKTKQGRTDKGAITLGWKFELLNKKSGQLSGLMQLSIPQIIDIYSGTNLPRDKRNALVHGRAITDSGVANYMLFEDAPLSSAQAVIDSMTPVEDYVRNHPEVYFACKALNYRTEAKKYDGNRPLCVYVDWTIDNGKLKGDLVFDEPLTQGGNYAYEKLSRALESLEIQTVDDLNKSNVDNPECIWE